MKKILILGAICTLAFVSCGNNAGSTTDSSSAAIENIMTRVSVRSYLDQPVEAEKIETMLRAAMAAPTAGNRQPWHFVVLNGKSSIEAISSTSPRAEMLKSAPLAIVVCGDMEKTMDGPASEFWVQDVSAATENLLLAAHALGLGAVWTGVYPMQERVDAVKSALSLSENLVPLATVVIGYPAGDNTPKDKWVESNVTYMSD